MLHQGRAVGAGDGNLRPALRTLRGRAPRASDRAAAPEPAGPHALRVPRPPAAPRGRPRRADRRDLGRAAPQHHAPALTVLLSKLRAAVGADVLAGRGNRAPHPAPRRAGRRRAGAVRRAPGRVCGRPARLDTGLERRPLRAVRRRSPAVPRPRTTSPGSTSGAAGSTTRCENALEAYSAACLGLGGTELAGADRAARRLLAHNPLHEPGYSLLMQALAARGHVPEALRVYERPARYCATSSASRPAPRSPAPHPAARRPRSAVRSLVANERRHPPDSVR